MRPYLGRTILSRCLMLVGLVGGALLSSPASAQVTTPPPGSPQRAAILDALRGIAVSEVGGPIEFVVGTINVLGEWAFVEASPQRPGGGEIFYTYTRYQSAWDAGAFDDSATALLRETPAGWLVYEYNLGATDVVWMSRYPAPPDIFPGFGGAQPGGGIPGGAAPSGAAPGGVAPGGAAPGGGMGGGPVGGPSAMPR